MNQVTYLWNDAAPYSEFSPGQAQPSLKPFETEGAKSAVIVLAGGGYKRKAPHEGDPVAQIIQKAGLSAFVLDYRVAPCHKLAPLADAKRAVRVVRRMGYERVAVLGFSAGGSLCANAAVHFDYGISDSADETERLSSRPDAFIPCYPVVSMVSYTHNGSAAALLGDEENSYEERRFFSCELNVRKDTPPAFIWHTAEDASVPVENSLMLAKALSEKRIPFEMHIFPFGRHGLGLSEGDAHVGQWVQLMINWLYKMGF